MTRLLVLLRDCWNHNSLPKTGHSTNRYIEIAPFRFFYWYSTGCDTEEIKVVIVHPDGDELKIIHKLYGASPADWDCWKMGAWKLALNDAMDVIEAANLKRYAEVVTAKELAEQQKAAKEAAYTQKFEELFDAKV